MENINEEKLKEPDEADQGEERYSQGSGDHETEYTYENTIMMSKIEEYQSENLTRISKVMDALTNHMRESRDYVELNIKLLEEKLETKIENAMEKMIAVNAENFSMMCQKLNENAKQRKILDSDSDREIRSTKKPTPSTRRTAATPLSRKIGRDIDAELITMSTGKMKNRKGRRDNC